MAESLSHEDRARVAAALARDPDRVFAVDGEAGRLWVKRPRRRPGPVHHALAAFGAAIVGLPLVRPAAVSIGPAGLAAEAKRLRHLARDGWPVPAVLDVSPERLVLTDNGVPLGGALGREPDADRREALAAEALALLVRMHEAGAWHGAAQLRNFTRRADGLGLIDFEDDVEPAMPLASRQARDHFVFLLSATRYLDDAAVARLARRAAAAAPPAAWSEIEALARCVAPLHRLMRPLASRLGRDGAAIAATFDALAAARAS